MILSHPARMVVKRERKAEKDRITNAGKYVKRKELLYTFGKKVN